MSNMDMKLLNYYLALKSPEAGEWNASPENLHAEWATRDFVRKYASLDAYTRVCNVGIGTGDWDDFLGYWLREKGCLTSIDIDSDICEIFAYRQRREGHPNPSNVLNKSLFDSALSKGTFELVTIIGSAVVEAGAMESCLDGCLGLLKKGGYLMFMAHSRSAPIEGVLQYVKDNGLQLARSQRYEMLPRYPFYICMIRKSEC